jgi:hypothetical protein
MPDRWRFQGLTRHVELELHPDHVDPQGRDESLRELRRLVGAFRFRDPQASRVLLDVYRRLRGSPAGGVRPEDLDVGSPRLDAIADEILWAARSGLLRVRPLEHKAVVFRLEGVPEDVLGPEAEPTAWIEIELVDDEGKPVPNVAYRIECEDGRVRTGTTNLSGQAREEGLREGSCKVTFPGLNGPDWQAA